MHGGIERIAGESEKEEVRRVTDIVGNETVRSLWDGLVAACGERTFLRFRNRADETRSYTYRAFDEEINRAANVFLSDRKSTRLNSSHITPSRMPSSA